MLKVRVRFDLEHSEKTLKLDGEAQTYPQVGENWSFTVNHTGVPVQVDLGLILDTLSYGDMLLVRTDLIVAEVWLLNNDKNSGKILHFTPGRRPDLRSGAAHLNDNAGVLQLRREREVKRERLFDLLIGKTND